MVLLNLDATKCYDRIFPNFGAITLARLGLPQSFGIAIAKTIKSMTHRVLTAYGVSPNCIKQTSQELWSGIGQGSAAAGPIWISQEAVMISYYSTVSSGFSTQSPDGREQFQAHTIGYIDDNNLLLNYTDPNEEKITSNI